MKQKKYTIEEKNEIVKKYLNGELEKIPRLYALPSLSTLCNWTKQCKKNETVIDNRGKSSAGKGNHQRKKRLIAEKMSREEIVEYVKTAEDIKKLMFFLKKQVIDILNDKYTINLLC